MYKGTNKTALSSQQQISQAFLRLLENQPFASISISNICKEAKVSRQTFYSLFESKENLIVYMLGKSHSFTPGATCCNKEITIAELSSEYSSYIIQRRDFLKLLVENDIIHLMQESLYQSFIDCCSFLPGRDKTIRVFSARFVSGGLCAIAKTYLENDYISRKELESIISGLFEGNLLNTL